MTAIWLLSTKGRPEMCQATIEACYETGMTSPGVVYVDEDDGSYDNLQVPDNWTVHREPEWLSLQGSLTWCFENYPDATQYGWLADDTRPRTDGWDKLLEAGAGDWLLVYAKDLWFSENPGETEQLITGHNLSSGLCWGGELVRHVGWWALPGVRQAGIDMAWLDIVRPAGLFRYMPEVTVEHLNWRTKKRPWDETDDWTRDGVDYIDRDIVTKNWWYRSRGYRTLLAGLAESAAPGIDHEGIVAARRQSLVDALWANGKLPGARLQNILEGTYDNVFALEFFLDSHTDEEQKKLAAKSHPVVSEPDVRRLGTDRP